MGETLFDDRERRIERGTWADRHEPLTLPAANREMRQVLAAIGELIDEDDA